MKMVTIRQALQNVADYPNLVDDDMLQLKVHELVARSLFDIANHPDASVRGSYTRANRARKMIMDRMVGKRRPGSHPATRGNVEIEFLDLTGGELDTAKKEESDAGAEGVQPADG